MKTNSAARRLRGKAELFRGVKESNSAAEDTGADENEKDELEHSCLLLSKLLI